MPITTTPAIRVTLFFKDGETGWSESHYDTQRTTLLGAISTASTVLAPARQRLLANGPWLQYIRASFDFTFRDAQVAFLPAPAISTQQIIGQIVTGFGQYINNPAWSTLSAAVDWTCALIRGVGGDLYRKNIYISGIPYVDPTDDGAPQLDAALVAAAQNFGNVLFNNGYGFPTWARTAPLALAPVQISSITQPLPGQPWLFTCAVPHNLPANFNPAATNWRAFLHGLKFVPIIGTPARPSPSPNGGYRFNYVTATTFTLPTWIYPGSLQGNTLSYVPNSGSVQAQQRAFITYQSAAGGILLERFTHRKRGRPFDSPRGRSPSRKIYAP
jgi:hypothetical protein